MTNIDTNCHTCPNTACFMRKHARDTGMEDYLLQKNTHLCPKGQNIFIEGSPVHGLYFIYNGKIKVFTTGIYGKEQILRLSTSGEMIGQRGFSTHQHYPIGAVALEDTTMCHFSMDVMQQMLKHIHGLTYDFMLFYAEELHRSETRVRIIAQMTVREKVIDTLLYLNRKFGQSNDVLNISLSRREIADFAGTTEEQVIRVISALKKEDLILSKGKQLGIKNLDALGQEIDEHHYFIQS